MSDELKKLVEVFYQCPTEQQLELFQEIKKAFKDALTKRGEETEKTLYYLRDIFKSEFPENI